MKKSMIWLGPAFVGVVVAIVTVAILIATLVLADGDSSKPTGTDIPSTSETVETHEEPTEVATEAAPTEETTPEETPTEEVPTEAAPATPASIFGG